MIDGWAPCSRPLNPVLAGWNPIQSEGMRNNMHKFLRPAALALALLFLLSVPAAALRGDDEMIRVGLAYSSGAASAVNALADAGYELGYFDGNHFQVLGSIGNRYVSFCKDAMLYTNGRLVSENQSDGTAIKPYHLEVARDFASQREAESFISTVRAEGYEGEIFPASIGGAHRVRIEMYSQRGYAEADIDRVQNYTMGETVRAVGSDGNTITVIDLNTISIAYEIAVPSGSWPAARAADGGTMRNSIYDYNGAFELRRIDGGGITFVNVVSLQDYLKGVLPYEMDGAWPLEALKAQALCARSYVLFNTGKHSNYDICNTTHCQVYYGTTRETALVRQAVEETRNQIVAHEGRLISTFYASSSGGYTESSENAWGSTDYPYYAAVPDTYENRDEITTFSKTVTAAELTALVRELGGNIGTVTNCYVSQYTQPAGNVYEVTFEGANGTYKVSKTDNVRIKLNTLVKSPRFDIYSGSLNLYADNGRRLDQNVLYALDGEGNVLKTPATPHILSAGGLSQPKATGDGTFTFSGAGLGHNVGMSQYGAKGMAEAGMSYRDIILHYFTGVEILRTDEMG